MGSTGGKSRTLNSGFRPPTRSPESATSKGDQLELAENPEFPARGRGKENSWNSGFSPSWPGLPVVPGPFSGTPDSSEVSRGRGRRSVPDDLNGDFSKSGTSMGTGHSPTGTASGGAAASPISLPVAALAASRRGMPVTVPVGLPGVPVPDKRRAGDSGCRVTGHVTDFKLDQLVSQ
jgi:hypothetical protein